MTNLEAIKYKEGKLQLLDQRLLPHQSKYVDVKNTKDGWKLIQEMAVRGAPAIAIAAVLSLCVELLSSKKQLKSAADVVNFVNQKMDYLVTSRPTAVNLANAAAHIQALVADQDKNSTDKDGLINAVLQAGQKMLEDDISDNKSIGQYGAAALQQHAVQDKDTSTRKVSVLTHCNTGALACGGYGTALGVIRAVHEAGTLKHAYCTETRPYNQGSRLTAYELVCEKIPATLICDSAASSLMSNGGIQGVVVGADRVVANGDTANKIGTLNLAVAARHYGIPFFVAAPITTLDPNIPTGRQIVIEQRDPSEVTHHANKQVAANGIEVWNPAFDVTPASLITGIITNKGMVPKNSSDNTFRVASFCSDTSLHDQLYQPAGAGECSAADAASQPVGSGQRFEQFEELTTTSIIEYIGARDVLRNKLGGKLDGTQWDIKEVGDGNINFVYIVNGPEGAVCIKQGPPYIRIVKEWLLTQDRIRLQCESMQEQWRVCPEHIPEVFLMDAPMAALAMEYLPPPHETLRPAILEGKIFPLLGAQVAHLLAVTLFHTSALALRGAEFRKKVQQFSNPELCELTEQVIFTDPYYDAKMNRYSQPGLTQRVHSLWHNADIKAAVSEMKNIFLTKTEALLHGDLHLGSLMVTDTTCYSIDTEFAFYGPISFDVGKLLSSFALMYLALPAWHSPAKPRAQQRAWLLECMVQVWEGFAAEFKGLWEQQGMKGELFHEAVWGGGEGGGWGVGGDVVEGCADQYLGRMWREALGFCGTSVVRRIVGVAQLADYAIDDVDAKVAVESRALDFGTWLLSKGRHDVDNITALVEKLKEMGGELE